MSIPEIADPFSEMFKPEALYYNTRAADPAPLNFWGWALEGQIEFVYFFKVGDFIKIGISKDPVERARHIANRATETRPSIWSGEVQIIGYLPGTRKEEKALHMKYGNCWDRGEWFHATDELMEHAAKVQADQVHAEVEMKNHDLRNIAKDLGLDHEDVPADADTLNRLIDRSNLFRLNNF